MSPHTRTVATLRRIYRGHSQHVAAYVAQTISAPALREEFLRQVRENRTATEPAIQPTKTP